MTVKNQWRGEAICSWVNPATGWLSQFSTASLMFQAWKLEQEQLQQDEEKSKKTKNGPKGKQQPEAGKQADSKKSSLLAGHRRSVEKAPEAAPPVEQSAELHPGEETFSVKETSFLNSGLEPQVPRGPT